MTVIAVIEDPEEAEEGEEGNDAHALIKGKIKGGHAKKIANASEWVVEPKIESQN